MARKIDPYKELSDAYDLIMGEREEIPFLLDLVRKEHPEARNLLELACGTGKLLEPFAERYSVSGVDVSAPMLQIARRRIKRGKFFLRSMTSFEIDEKFDVIICLFNSLNHLDSFSDWRRTFRQCRKHLSDGGVFIFDINTPCSLESYGREFPWVEESSSNVIVTQFTSRKGDRLDMHVRVFSPAGRALYRLSEGVIRERAYPTPQVRRELKKHFSEIRVFDFLRKKVDRHSEVLYFVCR